MRTAYKLVHTPTGNESATTYEHALDALLFVERNFPRSANQYEVKPVEVEG